jgi:hypothetical protein
VKYIIDSEFIDTPTCSQLISLAILREDGESRYFEFPHSDSELTPWLRENVVPHLTQRWTPSTFEDAAAAIEEFIGSHKPEFWAYYGAYDWVALCQLFGALIEIPKGWPYYCRDIKQFCDSLGNPKLPEQGKGEHNALADARWNKVAYDFLTTA